MLDPIECVLAEHAHFSERLVNHASKDFTIICDGSLADLLWIANVQGCRPIEFVLRTATFFKTLGDLLAADGDLSTHGVLCLDDIFAETVEDRLISTARQCAVK